MAISAPSPQPSATDLSTADTPWVVAGPPRGRDLWSRLATWPLVLRAHRDLVYTSVRRDLQARFRGTVLGFAWVLAQPVVTFAIYAFLITELLGVRLGQDGSAPPATMAVYMFTGTLVWTSVADALTRSTSCVLEQRNLVQKVRFPAQLLPLQIGLSTLVTFAMGLVAFVGFTAVSDAWEVPGLALLAWAPVLLLLQLMLTTGLGLALSAAQVLFRDTQPVVGVLLTVGMFATPIFWVPSTEVLPDIQRWLPLVEMNPLHHLVYAWRSLLMSSEPDFVFDGSFPESLRIVASWAFGAFAFGSLLFFRVERHLADEV